jgi:hypothetical protein
MGFAPRVPQVEGEKFTSFWSVGDRGFGLYEQERRGSTFTAAVKLLQGTGIEMAKLSLPSLQAAAGVEVEVGGRPVPATLETAEGKSLVAMGELVRLGPGSEIRVTVQNRA